MLHYLGGNLDGIFAEMSGDDDIKIAEDGSFEIPEKYIPGLCDGWDRFDFIKRLDGKNKFYTAYNLSMMYLWLLKTRFEDTYCMGIYLDFHILVIIHYAQLHEKLSNPQKLWEFVYEWICEHGDWIDRLRSMGISAEVESANVLGEIIRNIVHNA